MDISPATQGEQENEQPQQVSSHSLSAHHTNTPPLIVSTQRSIREQHITDTAFNDTQLSANTLSQLIVSIPIIQRATRSMKIIVSSPHPPRETHAVHELSDQSHSDINSPLARKRVRLATTTGNKRCQPSSALQGASCTDIPPAKRVRRDSPKRLTGRKKCQAPLCKVLVVQIFHQLKGFTTRDRNDCLLQPEEKSANLAPLCKVLVVQIFHQLKGFAVTALNG